MSLLDTPIDPSTRVVDNGRIWIPESALAMRRELEHISSKAAHDGRLTLFRGQQDRRWKIESTFARNVKHVIGVKPGEMLSQRAASCGHLVRFLYGALLFKFGTHLVPSPELTALAHVLPPGPWTRWNVRQPSRSKTWDARAKCRLRSA